MADRLHRKRLCVMIVEQDFDFGIKLADWLAAHGYQAVLVRSVKMAIDECRVLRPQIVFIGFSHSRPSTPIDLSELLRVIKTTCPHAPVVTKGAQTWGDLTSIGHVVESELSTAASSRASTNTPSDARHDGIIETRSHERAVRGEAAIWIG